MEKIFKSIDEQIEILKNKGLKFKDEEKAKEILLRENYYYLTQDYEDVFLNLKKSKNGQEEYNKDTYFEELFAIYNLDRELRNLIFDYINLVETHVKSYVSYVFSKKYGCKNYLIRENFINGMKYDKQISKLFENIEKNKEISFSIPNNDERKYFEKNKVLPLWVFVKIFTFGNITNFYSLMKQEDKEEVAKLLKNNPYSIAQYLRMLNIVRNICAHGGILFNIRMVRHIYESDCDYHEILNIPKINNRYIMGTNDLFGILIILKKLIDRKSFSKMFIKIENLLSDVKKEVDSESFENLLEDMGFPKNYKLLDEI